MIQLLWTCLRKGCRYNPHSWFVSRVVCIFASICLVCHFALLPSPPTPNPSPPPNSLCPITTIQRVTTTRHIHFTCLHQLTRAVRDVSVFSDDALGQRLEPVSEQAVSEVGQVQWSVPFKYNKPKWHFMPFWLASPYPLPPLTPSFTPAPFNTSPVYRSWPRYVT